MATDFGQLPGFKKTFVASMLKRKSSGAHVRDGMRRIDIQLDSIGVGKFRRFGRFIFGMTVVQDHGLVEADALRDGACTAHG